MVSTRNIFSFYCSVPRSNICSGRQLRLALGVVGVVGGACRRRHQFWGAKCAKFHLEPPTPFSLFQNKVGCPPCPYRKFKRKPSSQFWDIRKNIFDPVSVCSVLKFQKTHPKKRSCVIVLDTPSQGTIIRWLELSREVPLIFQYFPVLYTQPWVFIPSNRVPQSGPSARVLIGWKMERTPPYN